MICPSCGHVNVPGADECGNCQFALAAVDGQPSGADAIEESFLNDTVQTLKFRAPVTVGLNDKLGLALDRMVAQSVGALLVTDDKGRLVGILTERDYLKKIVGVVTDYAHRAISDYMTADPETVSPNDPLALVLQKMAVGGYRHIPVVEEDGCPVGLVSVRDAIRHITKLSDNVR